MERQQDEIIHKAFDLFSRYGIKSVSMDDLARELAMSKKTLYQVVVDKNSLVSDVLDYMESTVEKSLEVFQNKEFNAIKQFFILAKSLEHFKLSCQPSFIYDLHKYYPSLINDTKVKKANSLSRAFLSNLKQGKSEGLYYSDINEDLICRLLVHINLEIFSPGSEFFTEQEWGDHANKDEIFKYHFRGVCTAKGLVELERLADSEGYTGKNTKK